MLNTQNNIIELQSIVSNLTVGQEEVVYAGMFVDTMVLTLTHTDSAGEEFVIKTKESAKMLSINGVSEISEFVVNNAKVARISEDDFTITFSRGDEVIVEVTCASGVGAFGEHTTISLA